MIGSVAYNDRNDRGINYFNVSRRKLETEAATGGVLQKSCS